MNHALAVLLGLRNRMFPASAQFPFDEVSHSWSICPPVFFSR